MYIREVYRVVVILLLNALIRVQYDFINLYIVTWYVLRNCIIESLMYKKRNNIRYFCIFLHICKLLMQKRATT